MRAKILGMFAREFERAAYFVVGFGVGIGITIEHRGPISIAIVAIGCALWFVFIYLLSSANRKDPNADY